MSGNAQSKFANEYNSEEDVNNYKEEYENVTDSYYHCGNCYYRTTHRCDPNANMKADHTAPLAVKEEENI